MKIFSNMCVRSLRFLFVLSTVICFSLTKSMEEKERGIKDEESISAKEKGKIAILAYGSLVGRPGNLKIRAPFEKTDFRMPVGLTRLSKEPPKKLTLVIDSGQDVQRPIWYALSQYEYLPNALIDLAARERVGADPKTGIRKLRNIYFMNKLSGRIPAEFESEAERKIGYGDWVIKEEKEPKLGAQIERKKLTDDQAKKIAQWADKNGYMAVIWASFDPNISKGEVLELLKTDENIRETTKNYLKQSHIETPTKQERELVDLKESEHI